MGRITVKLFFGLSLIGFALSLITHIVTFFGINPQKVIPEVWLLHIGIFIVFIPLLIIYRKEDAESYIKHAPSWMQMLCIVFLIYGVVNFALFSKLSGGGSPEIWGSKYALLSHGTLIRDLSESEYELQKAYKVRGFSGSWMFFYFYALTAYCSYLRKQKEVDSA